MAKKTGAILPALQTKVLPAPHLLFVWESFGKLTTARSYYGMGLPGPIAWPVITAFARENGVRHLERFCSLIGRMDQEWQRYMNKRAASPATTG